MGIWFQKTTDKSAVIYRVNDRYLYDVYALWMGRYGKLVNGPLLQTGSMDTLEQAKRMCLSYLYA